MKSRNFLIRQSIDIAWTALPVLLAILAGLAIIFFALDPVPPQSIRIATGQPNATYDLVGQRYKQAMAAHGIDVTLVRSAGSLENIELLRNGKADVAIVQNAGLDREIRDRHEIDSLGLMFRQPFWVFYRADSPTLQARLHQQTPARLEQILTDRTNIGLPNSGGRALAQRLFGKLGIHQLDHLPALGVDQSVKALLTGQIDATMFVASEDAPALLDLFSEMRRKGSAIRLLSLANAEGFTLNIPHLSTTVLPKGILNFNDNIPEQNVTLLATTASVLVREDVHPALQNLLITTAMRIHQPWNWFQKEGEFPQLQPSLFHLSEEAQRYARQGNMPRWRRLPFWLANLFDRNWLALVALMAFLLPASRLVPPIYAWRIRRRIFRWYADLYTIEAAIRKDRKTRPAILRALDELQRQVEQVKIPISRADELYRLRSHIELVRQRTTHPPQPSSH